MSSLFWNSGAREASSSELSSPIATSFSKPASPSFDADGPEQRAALVVLPQEHLPLVRLQRLHRGDDRQSIPVRRDPFTCGNTSWMPWYSEAMSGPKMCCVSTPPGVSRARASS